MARRERLATIPDREAAKRRLAELWLAVLNDQSSAAPDHIALLVNSQQTSIRFCILVQLLGKLVKPDLDALCLQRGDGSKGKWDPRGFAAKVVVPWNRANQNVLGKSGDPYVSNPLRRPRVDAGLDQMADREQWERLCLTLRDVQETNDPVNTEQVCRNVLVATRDRLRGLAFVYIVPPRVSLQQAERLVREFLAVGSGGDRGLSVAAALFGTIGQRLQIYSEVRRNVVNAADAATQSAGDLECVGPTGRIILAVEVKERQIGEADVQEALAKARQFNVTELLLCTQGIRSADHDAVASIFMSAWASGTNIYHATIYDIMRGALPLLGEAGIHQFVAQVGTQLDGFSTQPMHRKAWKALLDAL